MNYENMILTRDTIANLPEEKFMYGVWGRNNDEHCGTIACVAGWALVSAGWKIVGSTFHKDGEEPLYDGTTIPERARMWLGLSLSEADDLFYGHGLPGGMSSTRDDVVAYMDKMIESKEARVLESVA